MPFILVGSGDDLIITIPTDRTTNWGANFKANFATKIAEHNHTGSGKGQKLTASALAADSVNDTHILLGNDKFQRGRNQADSANINIIKVNTSDKLALGADLANFAMINDTYITGRNNGDSAYINLLKVNTSDKIAVGADLANLDIVTNVFFRSRNNADDGYINLVKSNTSDLITFGADQGNTKTFTIADNQSSAANVTGVLITAAAGNTAFVHYKIFINATTKLVEHGLLELSFDGTNWDIVQTFTHDNSLVAFTITAGGQLQYTTPAYSGYNAGTMNFNVTKL